MFRIGEIVAIKGHVWSRNHCNQLIRGIVITYTDQERYYLVKWTDGDFTECTPDVLTTVER